MYDGRDSAFLSNREVGTDQNALALLSRQNVIQIFSDENVFRQICYLDRTIANQIKFSLEQHCKNLKT